MKIKTKLTFTYIEDKYAKIAYNSLYPDNEGFIESEVENNKLICYIKSDEINSVLNTIEDLIHCEKMIEMTSKIV